MTKSNNFTSPDLLNRQPDYSKSKEENEAEFRKRYLEIYGDYLPGPAINPTIGSAPICMSCRHLHEIGLKCDAFPAGIPKEIIFGSWDHTRPVPGDNGIAFEPKD